MLRTLLIVSAILVAAAIGACIVVSPVGSVFTGASAKLVCSAIFVAGRDEALVRQQELERLSSPGKYLGLADVTVHHAGRAVTATLFGLWPRTAIERTGIGCTADEGISVAALRAQGRGIAPPPARHPGLLWPDGEAVLVEDLPAGVDGPRLGAALDRAFDDPDPERPRRTRAIVVVHEGRIVAERYSHGFGPDTGHLSNSMAKTVVGALVGVLVGKGRLDLTAPAPIAEWRKPGDPRGAITLEDLLRMRSGLEFEESYTKLKSDITMMFGSGDLAGFAAAKPLEATPGEVWHYSTGTANILGRIVSEAAGKTFTERVSFPRRALFDPVGMRTAVLEVDGRGNFIGGSLMFASARDYARLGLLYLRDGVWNGQRILPEGWVAKTLTPTPQAPPEWSYGFQIWLNSGADPAIRRWPRLPPDMYAMLGHQQQHVVMIPSHHLVVVRTGLSEFDTWRLEDLVVDVIGAIRAGPRVGGLRSADRTERDDNAATAHHP